MEEAVLHLYEYSYESSLSVKFKGPAAQVRDLKPETQKIPLKA